VPVQVLCPVVFVSICYYMIGLQPAIAKFFNACMVAVATALSGMAVGTVAGAAFPDITMALVVLPLILLPLMMFSGLFVNVGNLPAYFAWIKWVSPMKYAYQALMKNEYEGLRFAKCDPSKEPCSGELVLEQMSMSGGLGIGENMATLFGIYAILMVIGFLALAVMSRRRRRW
jgi:ATP-binding cassette subfamily G (WHITE) protein 1